jgi:hypothetical protein
MHGKSLSGMLKTLYIHGLDSAPRPDKLEILKSLELDVDGLHIDYRENLDAYWVLENYIRQNDIEFIIGSSYGGMLGYYLSAALNIPALLFNPALHSMSLEPELPKLRDIPQAPLFVVLGANDQTIHPKKTLDFFRANKIKTARIITCHWLAHKIDLRTFEEMAQWARHSLITRKA